MDRFCRSEEMKKLVPNVKACHCLVPEVSTGSILQVPKVGIALGFLQWNNNSQSLDDFLKPETTALWWKHVIMNASKVGKGLSIDTEAYILDLKHWIEAIDPRHRYGNNLNLYYKEWFKSSTSQHFFFWLDFGDGKDVDLEACPRSKLDKQCVKYFGPQEREYYEFVVVDGKILHNITRIPLHHESPQSTYIFVVSTSKKLYIGKNIQKEKGLFHHSSFLAGEATLTAGRLLVEDGVLKRISPSSGHYKPTENSLERFLSILKENGVNLDEVQIRKANEDFWSP